jgi:hypothetical protein
MLSKFNLGSKALIIVDRLFEKVEFGRKKSKVIELPDPLSPFSPNAL